MAFTFFKLNLQMSINFKLWNIIVSKIVSKESYIKNILVR